MVHFNTMLRVTLVRDFRAMAQRKEFNFSGQMAQGLALGVYVQMGCQNRSLVI